MIYQHPISPMISVIMPAYNAEKYIKEAINSVLRQTYDNFEFIIIDDGSLDNTVKEIKKYIDPRIIFIQNEKNKGLIETLNNAIRIAKGKYIARMDADDIACSERLEKQFNYMENNPDISILGANLRYISGTYETHFPEKYEDIKIQMLESNKISHPTVMMRKAHIVNSQLRYNENYPSAEDYKLWIDAIQNGLKIENMPDILLFYRIHENQISSQKKQEQERITQKIIKEYSLLFAGEDEKLSNKELAIISKRFEYVNPPKPIFDLMYKLRKINLKNKFFNIKAYNKYLKDTLYIYLTKKDVTDIFNNKNYNLEFKFWILKVYFSKYIKNTVS